MWWGWRSPSTCPPHRTPSPYTLGFTLRLPLIEGGIRAQGGAAGLLRAEEEHHQPLGSETSRAGP